MEEVKRLISGDTLGLIYFYIFAIYVVFASIITTFVKSKKNAALINIGLSAVLLLGTIGILIYWQSGHVFVDGFKNSFYGIVGILFVFIVRDLIAIIRPQGNSTPVVIILTVGATALMFYAVKPEYRYMLYMIPLFIEIMVYDASEMANMPVLMTGEAIFGLPIFIAFKQYNCLLIDIIVLIISMIGYFKYYKLSAFDTMQQKSKERQKSKVQEEIKRRNASRDKTLKKLKKFQRNAE